MDVHTSEIRSYNMSRIRGRDTKPELLLRKTLWNLGLRYRLNYKLPGKPDLVFVGKKIAVFVDGCFWHGCPHHAVKPKTNVRFWDEKLRKNIERDQNINTLLRKAGWQVIRIWEHEIKNDVSSCGERIADACKNADTVK